MDTPKIAVIILNWNGIEDTVECLESLSEVEYPNFEIIVADNGSTDGSITLLRKSFQQVFLLENGENLGFAEGNNRAIKIALDRGAKFLFLLNNDTIVAPDALSAFIAKADRQTILGPKLYTYSDPKRFDHLGGNWNQKLGQFDLIGNRVLDDGIQFEKSLELDYVCGAALFAPRQAFEKVGLLEKRYFLFFEESDFCLSAKKQGFRVLYIPEAKIWHKVSASMTGGRPHTTYFFWRNRLLFLKRQIEAKERRRLFWRVIFPEVLHIFKLYCLKSLQLRLWYCLKKGEDHSIRLRKIRTYKAALCGFRDYYLKRFGNAPSWIFGQ
ncbi:MAG: glycosyltransferase family 2 protein [Simkaniaceae bacterium]